MRLSSLALKIALAALVALAVSIGVLTRPPVYLASGHQYEGFKSVVILGNETTVTQTFATGGPNLASIAVFPAITNRETSGTLTLTIFEIRSRDATAPISTWHKKKLATATVRIDRLSNNNGLSEIRFRPVKAKSHTYAVALRTRSERGPWLFVSEQLAERPNKTSEDWKDKYPGGALFLEDRPERTDLNFATYSYRPLGKLKITGPKPSLSGLLRPPVIIGVMALLVVAGTGWLSLLVGNPGLNVGKTDLPRGM